MRGAVRASRIAGAERRASFSSHSFTRSPSRLAATASFDSVSPELAISLTDMRTRSTSALRGATQASTALGAGRAVARHRGGQPPLRIADRIERAVERQPVEIVGDDDAARGIGDVIEPEERLGGKIGGRDLGDVLAGAVGDQHDVGRRRQRRQRRRSGAPARPARLLRQLVLARPARGRRRLRQRGVERGNDRGDALAVMRDDRSSACAEIDIAQEPDQPVEQQILHAS